MTHTADVITITTAKIPNQVQVLAEALTLAQRGEMKDVIVIRTMTDGTIDLSYAGCKAGDLAVGALVLQKAALKLIEAD